MRVYEMFWPFNLRSLATDSLIKLFWEQLSNKVFNFFDEPWTSIFWIGRIVSPSLHPLMVTELEAETSTLVLPETVPSLSFPSFQFFLVTHSSVLQQINLWFNSLPQGHPRVSSSLWHSKTLWPISRQYVHMGMLDHTKPNRNLLSVALSCHMGQLEMEWLSSQRRHVLESLNFLLSLPLLLLEVWLDLFPSRKVELEVEVCPQLLLEDVLE